MLIIVMPDIVMNDRPPGHRHLGNVGMPDIDPLRGMKVESRHIAAPFRAQGKTFHFRSAGCQTKLAAMAGDGFDAAAALAQAQVGTAVAAMTLSSLSVIRNVLRLRGVRV
jgi:cation transport ATPase